MPSLIYEIINYDVWGNEKDGYEVNDCRYTGLQITIEEDASDRDIIQSLKKDFLANGLHVKTFTIEGEWPYSLYVTCNKKGKTNYPVCELRPKAA